MTGLTCLFPSCAEGGTGTNHGHKTTIVQPVVLSCMPVTRLLAWMTRASGLARDEGDGNSSEARMICAIPQGCTCLGKCREHQAIAARGKLAQASRRASPITSAECAEPRFFRMPWNKRSDLRAPTSRSQSRAVARRRIKRVESRAARGRAQATQDWAGAAGLPPRHLMRWAPPIRRIVATLPDPGYFGRPLFTGTYLTLPSSN